MKEFNKEMILKKFDKETKKSRSYWAEKAKNYAYSLLENFEDDRNFDNVSKFKKALLNGAKDWEQYSYWGNSSTDPDTVKALLRVQEFNNNILEPACGGGAISETLKKASYSVKSSDLVPRGYGEQLDFFKITSWEGTS